MFRLLFFTIYILFNLIIYFYLISDLRIKRRYKTFIVFALILPFFSRKFIKWSYYFNNETLTVLISYLTNIWLGIMIITLTLSLIFIPLKICMYLVNKHYYYKYKSRLSWLWLGVIIITLIYSLFESNAVKLNHIKLKSDKIPTGKILRITQLSDLHIGAMLSKTKFNRIIKLIEQSNPDILAITGDFIESKIAYQNYLETEFQKINPRYGKIFVTGNHDDHIPESDLNKFLENCNIINGDNKIISINDFAVIAGSSDMGWSSHEDELKNDFELLKAVDKKKYVIFLKHKPVVSPNIINKFDLMLSGHTHNGQIFPGKIIVRQMYEYISGLYKLSDTAFLYVSNGASTWGPPMRLFSFPEITLFEITN